MKIMTTEYTHEFAILAGMIHLLDSKLYQALKECTLRYLISTKTLEVFTFSDNGRTVIHGQLKCLIKHFSAHLEVDKMILYHNDLMIESIEKRKRMGV